LWIDKASYISEYTGISGLAHPWASFF